MKVSLKTYEITDLNDYSTVTNFNKCKEELRKHIECKKKYIL